jgi:hypothetical protein
VARAAARAAIDAATRELVARRAIALEGTPVRPRVRFIEPHATLLGAFVGADATASIRVERPGRTRVRALFARDEAIVEQVSLPGQGNQAEVAHPRAQALDLLFADLPFQPDYADNPGRVPHELTLTMLDRAERVLQQGSERPSWLSSAAGPVACPHGLGDDRRAEPPPRRDRARRPDLVDGRRNARHWRVERVGTQPSVTIRLVSSSDDEIRRRLTAAWSRDAMHPAR